MTCGSGGCSPWCLRCLQCLRYLWHSDIRSVPGVCTVVPRVPEVPGLSEVSEVPGVPEVSGVYEVPGVSEVCECLPMIQWQPSTFLTFIQFQSVIHRIKVGIDLIELPVSSKGNCTYWFQSGSHCLKRSLSHCRLSVQSDAPIWLSRKAHIRPRSRILQSLNQWQARGAHRLQAQHHECLTPPT